MNYRLTCAVALTACLFGSAPVLAADWTAPVTNAPATNAPAAEVASNRSAPVPTEGTAQMADPQGYVRTAQYMMSPSPAPLQDGLHDDHRWPAMQHCITQATPADFNNCLASAFMQDGTGSSLSLLPRRR